MRKTNRIFAFAITFLYISIISGHTSLALNVRGFSREKKLTRALRHPKAKSETDRAVPARHEAPPIALDHLTYARLTHEHWGKIVIVETVLKTPKDNAPSTDASGTAELNNAEKFIKPYLLKPWFDQRAMGVRSKARGTGFVCGVDADQQKIFICTNAHIVEDRSEVTVRTASGTEYRAIVLAETAEPDAAVLMIESKEKIPPLAWGDSDGVSVGEAVMAIGNPRGFYYSVSRGIISGKRLMRTAEDAAASRFFQIDMTINFGSSGSPLFNMRGEVIGIVHAIWDDSQGIAFAIPANDFRKIIETIKSQPAQNAPPT